MDNKKRNHMLDILKGVFIIVVIFAHYDWRKGESMKMLFPFWVDIAVPVFMMISGYVYAMSFERKKITSLRQAYEPYTVLKRLLRFYIPFVMIYIPEIIILLITHERTTLEIFKGFLVGGYGPGSYYVPVMLEFVFLFPLIYFAVKKWFFRAVVGMLAVNVAYEFAKWSLGMEIATYRLIILRYLFIIAAGAYMNIAIKQHYYEWLGYVVIFIGFIWLLLDNYYGITIKAFDNGYWARTTCIACFFTIPIVWQLVRSKSLSGISIKPLEMLGQASYNIFLTQRLFYRYFADMVYSKIGARGLEIVVCMVICVVSGLLFYQIDKRVTPYFLTRLNGREKLCYNKNKLNDGVNDQSNN